MAFSDDMDSLQLGLPEIRRRQYAGKTEETVSEKRPQVNTGDRSPQEIPLQRIGLRNRYCRLGKTCQNTHAPLSILDDGIGSAYTKFLKSWSGDIDFAIHILYEIHLLFLTLIIVFLYCFLAVLGVSHQGGGRTIINGFPRDHDFRDNSGARGAGISQSPYNDVSLLFLNQRQKEAI